MNATCPDREILEAYLVGTLDDEAVDGHLEDCAECQAKLDQLDAVINRPFACLREPAVATDDWQETAYQHLVTRAKGYTPTIVQDQSLPRQLGDYLLLELIAQSGMGRVYKALHVHLKKTVAVKVIHESLVLSSQARQRFRREMEAVGRLASPHIVTAFDAGEADGVDFLAMEFIDGDDFRGLVQKRGPLPIPLAIDCILQAARGLAVAHAASIVHRDIKPGNLILSNDGVVKVLDLGLARVYADETDLGVIMGTPAWIAPEQAVNTDTADARADIYGLGCTLYFLLTGDVVYPHKHALELIAAHRSGPIPSVRTRRPNCPRGLDALCQRMLAKDPKDRPASMNEVVTELERLQRPTRNPVGWRSVIAASVLIAACALLAFAFWNQPGPDKNDKKPDDAKIAMPKEGATPKIDMVKIKPGEFFMGASDADPNAKAAEKPRRKTKITRAFFLAIVEVTQEQYEETIGKNPSAFSKTGINKARVKDLDTRKHPVESVSWLDAVRFCNKLSERHELSSFYKIDGEVVTIAGGAGYRLPTEAEWEYACRAGATTTWSFGEKAEDLKEYAWYAENSDDRTHPVGQKKANQWGLYDMYGNVPEWCWDRYDPEYYAYAPRSDPPGSGTKNLRAFRGDGWNSRLPRSPARDGLGFLYGSERSINIIGFRVARNAE